MKSFTILLLLCMVCIIAGCGKYYYQEGKSFAECERDRADCFTELKKHADWEMPGAYEHEFMEECMKRKGYRLVTCLLMSNARILLRVCMGRSTKTGEA